jgi:hypothetical protein
MESTRFVFMVVRHVTENYLTQHPQVNLTYPEINWDFHFRKNSIRQQDIVIQALWCNEMYKEMPVACADTQSD